MQRRRLRLAFALFLFSFALPLGAQERFRLDEPVQPHPEGLRAIDQLRSPYCPGMMLEVCPSPQARLLRDTLELLAWSGEPSDTIVAWMLARYGEEYRAVPLTRGSGLWAWLMPPMALLAGIVVLIMALKHFRGQRDEVPVHAHDLTMEDESALAEAMEELKASEEVPF
jgi:cytochrome c-type biogenesis protein CcmH/NrfF